MLKLPIEKDLKMMSTETKQTKDVETDKKHPSKPAEQAELDDMLRYFFPGISYFIAFTPSQLCDPESLFQFLDFQNTEAEINYIKTCVNYESKEKKNNERLSRELFNILKEHDNEAVQHFVKLLSQFCYTKELSEMVYDWSDEEKEAVFSSRKLSPDNLDCRFYYPCRLVIVNEPVFGKSLEIAARDLQKDGPKLFVTKLSSLLKTFL